MIKGNLGSVEVSHESILTGDNHIVVSYQANTPEDSGIKIGSPVSLEREGGMVKNIVIPGGSDPMGIALDNLENASTGTIRVVVFGAVKRDAVDFTAPFNFEPADENSVVENLRKNGIYVIN